MGRNTPRSYPKGDRPELPVDPPEVKRICPTVSRTFVPLAVKHGGVTMAHVMLACGVTMREASTFLRDLKADGRAVRFGGEPGKPFVWCLPRAEG